MVADVNFVFKLQHHTEDDCSRQQRYATDRKPRKTARLLLENETRGRYKKTPGFALVRYGSVWFTSARVIITITPLRVTENWTTAVQQYGSISWSGPADPSQRTQRRSSLHTLLCKHGYLGWHPSILGQGGCCRASTAGTSPLPVLFVGMVPR